MFFSIAVQHYKLRDIWFDFMNLLLMSIYFFKFGNQSKVLQSKISFSKTSRLEKLLRRYTAIQIQKKEKMIGKLTSSTDDNGEPERKENKVDNSAKSHLIDEKELFLGPTFYLAKLKKKLFIYNFVKKMKLFSFIGVQIVTAVMILTLAVLQRTLMSLFYIVLCLILFWNMKDFFY